MDPARSYRKISSHKTSTEKIAKLLEFSHVFSKCWWRIFFSTKSVLQECKSSIFLHNFLKKSSRGVEVFQAELPNPRIKAFCNVCTSTSKESPRAAPILDILGAMGRRITYHPYQPPKLITYHHAQRSKDGEKNAIKLRCLEDLSNARNLKCPVCSLKSRLHVL